MPRLLGCWLAPAPLSPRSALLPPPFSSASPAASGRLSLAPRLWMNSPSCARLLRLLLLCGGVVEPPTAPYRPTQSSASMVVIWAELSRLKQGEQLHECKEKSIALQ